MNFSLSNNFGAKRTGNFNFIPDPSLFRRYYQSCDRFTHSKSSRLHVLADGPKQCLSQQLLHKSKILIWLEVNSQDSQQNNLVGAVDYLDCCTHVSYCLIDKSQVLKYYSSCCILPI